LIRSHWRLTSDAVRASLGSSLGRRDRYQITVGVAGRRRPARARWQQPAWSDCSTGSVRTAGPCKVNPGSRDTVSLAARGEIGLDDGVRRQVLEGSGSGNMAIHEVDTV